MASKIANPMMMGESPLPVLASLHHVGRIAAAIAVFASRPEQCLGVGRNDHAPDALVPGYNRRMALVPKSEGGGLSAKIP